MHFIKRSSEPLKTHGKVNILDYYIDNNFKLLISININILFRVIFENHFLRYNLISVEYDSPKQS